MVRNNSTILKRKHQFIPTLLLTCCNVWQCGQLTKWLNILNASYQTQIRKPLLENKVFRF